MPLFNFNVAHAGNHVVCASEGGYLVGKTHSKDKEKNEEKIAKSKALLYIN